MCTKIGIVEVGSTNTKAYRIEKNIITEIGFKTIEFKKNYQADGTISYSDISLLSAFINENFDKDEKVYVYATSIFRNMPENESKIFSNRLHEKTNVLEFNVVSAKKENEYTVAGAILGVKYDGNICVFIGGGGSTEISICNSGKIVEMANSNFGVSDVMNEFPSLSDDVTNIDVDKVTNFILSNLKVPQNKANLMIMAGGDFLLRYYNANYPARQNLYFSSQNHPIAISYEDNRKYEDKYYHSVSLNMLKKTTPDNPKWWNGTRSMCAVSNAVAISVEAKILIPTRISMIYGIAASLQSLML